MMAEEGYELKPVMIVRQSKLLLGMRMIFVHLFFFLLCVVWLIFFDEGESIETKFRAFAWINLLELLALFYAAIRWHNHYYIVKEDRILTNRGVFLKHQWVFAIRNIESIDLEQGFFGRIFNFGTLYFHAPTLNKKISMWGISSPRRKEMVIERLLPATQDIRRGRQGGGRVMMIKEQS